MINDIERESIDKDFISQLLGSFGEIYKDDLKPYQKKKLLYSTLKRIEFSDKLLRVGVPLDPSAAKTDDYLRRDVSSIIPSGSHC